MKKLFLILFATMAFVACSDEDEPGTPKPVDKYTGGFYVLNEGQYGKSPATLNYYNGTGWDRMIFQANNPDVTLGTSGTMGVCSNKYMYVVAKQTPFVVEIDLSTFVRNAEIASGLDAGAQASAFALIDDARGVLTTTKGAYVVTLNPLALGEKFTGDVTGTQDVVVSNGHIFITTNSALKVYNASTLDFEQDLAIAKTGFAQAGGFLWAANATKLLKIDAKSLTAEEITLPDNLSVFYNSFVYTPTGLQASPQGDALYFAQTTVEGYSISGRDIYKYTIASGEAKKLFTAPVDGVNKWSIYGAGVNVDPRSGHIYAVYTEDGWGEHFLKTAIFELDASGAQVRKIDYTSNPETVYWFPSMLLFR